MNFLVIYKINNIHILLIGTLVFRGKFSFLTIPSETNEERFCDVEVTTFSIHSCASKRLIMSMMTLKSAHGGSDRQKTSIDCRETE